MYGKGTKKGTVKFSLKPDAAAKKVVLVGQSAIGSPSKCGSRRTVPSPSPSPWKPAPTSTSHCRPEWVVDPDNSTWALNPYGTLNSVANIQA